MAGATSSQRVMAAGLRWGLMCGRVGVVLALVCGQPLGWAWAAEEPPTLGTPPAALNLHLELSSSSIRFSQEGRPGLLVADQAVQMRVSCFGQSWSVAARATPLTRRSGPGEIGPERLFVRSDATQPQPDVGAGPGFVPLAEPALIAAEAARVYSTPLEFRLWTRWEDRPGEYAGDIQFTAVVKP